MENLHQELKLEIFSRLPAESVLECKLVCKPWLRLIKTDPLFPQKHLHRRLLAQQQLHDVHNEDFRQSQNSTGGFELGFIYMNYFEGRKKSCQQWYGKYGKNDDEDKHPFRAFKRINHHTIMKGPSSWNVFTGSCNGLICSAIRHNGIEDPIYICNPITREFVNLPRYIIRDENPRKNHTMRSGFGYDPSTNEYKVVRIFYPNCFQSLGRVQVYTLGDGNGWRDKGEITYSIFYGRRSVLVNGEIHWLVNNWKIVAFNLAREEFHLTASPPIVVDQSRLCVMGKWLCLTHPVHINGDSYVELWLLKKKTSSTSYDDMNEQEYKRGGWIKEFTIPINYPYPISIDIIGLTKRGEVLFMRRRCLYIYDLKTATLEEHRLNYYCGDSIIPHINSFVSLKAIGEKCRRRSKNYP